MTALFDRLDQLTPLDETEGEFVEHVRKVAAEKMHFAAILWPVYLGPRSLVLTQSPPLVAWLPDLGLLAVLVAALAIVLAAPRLLRESR